MAKFLQILFLTTAIITCQPTTSQSKSETRGVWVATVQNIDFPTTPLLSATMQKKEILEILDSCKNLQLNAVFLQIRPCADAFYKSRSEPWSKYLTGTQGEPPHPFYDPLAFWIEESHNRGMELHAWLNPFRVSMDTIEILSPKNVGMKHPDWVINYGGKRYLNPGEPAVLQYITGVVDEIATKYDVDGIHLDDYFYPYPIDNQQFNDDYTFKKFGYNYIDKADWRRNNVDNIVEALSKTIRYHNKGIKFGISPFGIWRNQTSDPNGSDTEGGISNYDDLYADVLGWLKNGWLDYVAPQLYWNVTHKKASYSTLLKWWSANSYETPLLIGESLYKITNKDKNWNDKKEIENHIRLCREDENCVGNIYFSYNHLKKELNGFQATLKVDDYKYPAIPAYFKKNELPNGSTVNIKKKRGYIIVNELNRDVDKGNLIRFGIYRYDERERVNYANSRNMVAISYSNKIKLPKRNKKEKGRFAITYIAPNGQESELSNVVEIKGR